MIQSTIGDLLDGELDARFESILDDFAKGVIKDLPIYRLYVVRDGDTVFYVGQAGDVVDRLYGHLGQGSWSWATGMSELGKLIKANLPTSRDWRIELYTIGELGVNGVDLAEEALIDILRPCLNRALNRNPSALPDKYINRDAQGRAQSRAVFAVFGEQE